MSTSKKVYVQSADVSRLSLVLAITICLPVGKDCTSWSANVCTHEPKAVPSRKEYNTFRKHDIYKHKCTDADQLPSKALAEHCSFL